MDEAGATFDGRLRRQRVLEDVDDEIEFHVDQHEIAVDESVLQFIWQFRQSFKRDLLLCRALTGGGEARDLAALPREWRSMPPT